MNSRDIIAGAALEAQTLERFLIGGDTRRAAQSLHLLQRALERALRLAQQETNGK